MKVSAQEIEQRQMVLEVEVEHEHLQRALDQAYKRIVNRINVPGFRRGRAPRPLVERMVGREALLEDAVEHLVPQVYQDALREQEIVPGGQASFEVTSTEPLQFRATVPLQPVVELGDYRAIKRLPTPILVEDEEVEAVLQNLRESNATWVPVEREVLVGDRVGLDVQATREGQTVIDSKDAEFVVNPEGPEPFPGFSAQLLGAKADQELSFSLTPPSEAEAVEGESPAEPPPTSPALVFTVRLHWVKEKQLPDLDDEFAKTVGEQETVQALTDEIREQIRRHKQVETLDQDREAVIDEVVSQATVEIPPQTIERQAQALLESMAARLDRQGISIQQYLQFTGKDETTFRSELLTEAERSLKRSLVLDKVAEAEALEVSEDELLSELELASRGATDPARAARQALRSADTRARLVSILRTRKAANHLLQLAGVVPAPAEAMAAAPDSSGETTP